MRQAFALNSAAMNLSRILGPALAGWLLLQLSSAAVYVVIAVISLFIFILLLRSKLPEAPKKAKHESFFRVIKDGILNSFSHPKIRQVLVLISLFFFAGISVVALAAVIASTRMGVNPLSYALLLSSIGVGAVCAVFLLPLLNEYFHEKVVFWIAVIGLAVTISLIAIAHHQSALFLLFFVSGFFWVVVVSLLTVSIQLSLSHAYRARGMAIYQLCLMGASALGAAVWGGLATRYGLTVTFLASGLTVLICLVPTYPLVQKPKL
jgi:predicted MFS family arabinose efflux permease